MLTGLAWSAGAVLPAARGNAAAVATGDGVLLFGGATNANGNTTPSSVYQYDPFNNVWTTTGAADRGRNGLGVGATGSNGPVGSDGYKYLSDIFLFGGATQGTPTASVANYWTQGDTITAPAMSTARYRLASATDPATGDLYAIGGLNSTNHALASVEQYDPQADAWSTVAPLPQAIYGASAASDGAGHILVFGGYNTSGTPVNTVYSYTIVSNQWSTAGAMPKALAGTAAVFGAYGQIYLIGGRTASSAVSDVSIYNPVTDEWTADTPLPSAEWGAAATIDANGTLDVMGGFNTAGAAVATLYQSAPLPAPEGLPTVPQIAFDNTWATYDANSHAVTATAYASDGSTPVDGDFAITYNGSSTPPVAAGTYNVLATFTSNDANYVDTVATTSLTIDPAVPTIALAGGGTISYDGLPHGITATATGVDGSTPVNGQMTYTYNGLTSVPVNPGTYTAVATFASLDSNYTGVTASTTITIPDPTIPTGVTAAGASTNSIQVSWNAVSGAAYYNVYERRVLHDPKGSGSTIIYALVSGAVSGTSAVITVPQLTGYTFYVTSVSGTGVESPRSAPASAEPLFAPSLYSMLWNGAVTSYASVPSGQTLQVTLLGYGNEPPTYALLSGPSTMSVNPTTGVVTYTPGPTEGGWISATFQASNSLGTASTTLQFDVLAPPVVDLNGASNSGSDFTATWSNAGAVHITDPTATLTDLESANLTSVVVALTAPQAADVLAANTSGTSIAQSFSGGALTLSGSDTLADYQQVLRSITYNNTSGGPGADSLTIRVVANDGTLASNTAVATINIPPVISLAAGAGSGAPNFTTTWYNQGTVPIESNILATVGAPSGVTSLQSLTVTLATFHTGDVLGLAPLGGVSLALTSSYSAGTLTLSGTDTVGHYQQALRFINYNNTAGGPVTSPITATFVANDGTLSSTPVTATINVNVASGQVLGNRLFYNNSKYDGNNGAVNASDDAAIASDKTGYTGTGTATFANVSSFNKGITGIMVDLQSGIGTHSAINLTSGDITFKVSPAAFVTTTYNQLSTWSAASTPSAISVRLGSGSGGSDRLEITWATGAIKNTWLEVDVHAGGNTGLSTDDVFYFGSAVGDSGAADTPLLAKTDGNDYNVPLNNIVGRTTPVWNLADYTKDGKVDGSDASVAMGGVFTLHYLANPTGPFAPNGGGSAAASPTASVVSPTPSPSVAGAISSGLSILGSSSSNTPSLRNTLEHVLTSPPVTKAIQTALHDPQLLQAVEQFASQFNAHDDALDGLLADLGLE